MADTDKDQDKHWLKWGMGLGGIVLLIAVGLFLLPTNEEPNDTAESPAASQPENESGQQPPADDENADSDEDLEEQCSFDTPDTELPTGSVEVIWAEHPYGPEVPGTEDHGPAQTGGGFYRCAAQTPTGAAMAAPSLWVSFAYGWEEAADPSPLATSYYDMLQGDVAEPDLIFHGFRVDDYSEERATISYWVSSSDASENTQVGFPLTVVWDADADPNPDWRLDLSQGEPPFEELESTTDYVELR